MKPVVAFVLLMGIVSSSLPGQSLGDATELYNKVRLHQFINFDSAEIAGSPFLNMDFEVGSTVDGSGTTFKDLSLRYNIYNDVFEFNRDGKAFNMEPDLYARVVYLGEKKFVYTQYENSVKEVKGYLEELANGYCTLYKKYRVSYEPPKPPAPYQDSSPGRFSSQSPSYYIKIEGKPITGIQNEKSLFEKIGDQRAGTEAYVKKNKLKFRKEEDLVSIIEYINDQNK